MSGRPTGKTASKLEAHNANTQLHSAFSCYIFNEKGELLVTQRAHSKKVWPDVWTNSVCGHPAPGESREAAIARRSQYELGMQVKNLSLILPNYTYKTPPYKGIIEHEFCPVYVAMMASKPALNPDEVEDLQWLKWEQFTDQATADKDHTWSWWSKDQIQQLEKNQKFQAFLRTLTK